MAIRLLGRLGSPQALDRLREIGADARLGPRKRTTALRALAAVDGPLSAQTVALLHRLARDSAGSDSRVRAQATRLLGERAGGQDAVIAVLRALAVQDRDPAVRAAALHGLAAGSAVRERAALLRWLEQRAKQDPAPSVRHAAMRARATLAAR